MLWRSDAALFELEILPNSAIGRKAASLSPAFVETNASCHRYVQTFHHATHG